MVCLSVSLDNKQQFIESEVFFHLQQQLAYSWLNKDKTSFNSSSVAFTYKKEYYSGLIESQTHLLDISSEQASLALAVSAQDPHVYKMVTLVDGHFDPNPLVIKILADHVRRTATPLAYLVINKDGKVLFNLNDVMDTYYKPSIKTLEKIRTWFPQPYKISLSSEDDISKILETCARKGMDTHFSSSTSSCYGAAVIANNTVYFSGVYSSFEKRLNIHAEMVSAIAAFADGNTDISHVAIISNKFVDDLTHMCGCCRQFFSEVQEKNNKPIEVYSFSFDGKKRQKFSLSNYLPYAWNSQQKNNESLKKFFKSSDTATSQMTEPLVEALLLFPQEGSGGKTAICTNTLAPGMVLNEIPFEKRKDISVLGSLIVNRDGTERLIINCLTHPTIEYVLLFGEETLSFRPSTNLLLALMDGYDKEKPGNVIKGGKGIAYHYPSISSDLLDIFRKNIRVLPLFKEDILPRYFEWIKPHLSPSLYSCLEEIHTQKKIYYDSLLKVVDCIAREEKTKTGALSLDPKEFQHLQPPIIFVEDNEEEPRMSFEVKKEQNAIFTSIQVKNNLYTLKGQDSFLMAYSLIDFFNKNNLYMGPEEQLFLGAELSRVEIEIKNKITNKPFVRSYFDAKEKISITLAPRTILKTDNTYYYRISIKKNKISVQSLTNDTCSPVFEFQATKLSALLRKLAQENRFEDYEQQMLHRMDVGIEIARASLALLNDKSFFQDFRNVFSLNETNFPLFVVEGDSFLNVHQNIITKLYTEGLTMSHPDKQKGTMCDGIVLAVYHRSGDSLKHFPQIYASGDQTVEQMRKDYAQQLLLPNSSGEYTYGSRTRSHFGIDQLEEAIQFLREKPDETFVIQRFDFVQDMVVKEVPILDKQGNFIKKQVEARSDPCLTHDIYFIDSGKLHSFHIARAHNIVNAYPENIFGLHDAYDAHIARSLGLELGDMFMLSSRANILLLTEEQRAKKIIAEPSKPLEDIDSSMGPYSLEHEVPSKGIGYLEIQLQEQIEKPDHDALQSLENYYGINLIEKVAEYLYRKGNDHNNPILGTYFPLTKQEKRLIFLQENVRAKQIQVTAVFLNGSKETLESDKKLCNYIATQFKKKLDVPLGKLFLFYVPLKT